MIRQDLNDRFDFDIQQNEEGGWGVALLPKWSRVGTNILETFPTLAEAEEYCRQHEGLEQVPWKCLQCGSRNVMARSADEGMKSHGPVMVYGYVQCLSCFNSWKDHKVRDSLLKQSKQERRIDK